MYLSYNHHSTGDDRFYSEDEHCRDSDDDSTETDQEEIEQALYAQIHYCNDEVYQGDVNDKQSFKFECTENGAVKLNKILLEDKTFSVALIEKGLISVTDSDITSINIKKGKKKNQLVESSKIKSMKKKDVIIIVDSQTSDAISVSSDVLNLSSEHAQTSDAVSVSSDVLNLSSEYDIESDCMLLDETIEDMGDIVLNVDNKTLLDNLTVRNIKEKDDAENWSILDRDRFQGNPLLGRYYKSPSYRCYNCNEIGHLSKVCPQPKKVIVCYLCGMSGHSGKSCVNPICYNCNKPGHKNAECTSSRRSRYTDCHRCQMLGHTSYECSEIWRQFHLTTNHGLLVRGKRHENTRKYCPNCAGDDHFDYECEEERMDRHVLPSYPFISQYRKSDVRVNKRHLEKQQEAWEVPVKRRKLDEDFNRNISLNVQNNKSDRKKTKDNEKLISGVKNNHNKRKKTKSKKKTKKEETFRKMMENDSYTFEKNTKKHFKDRNMKNGNKKKKEKKIKDSLQRNNKKKKEKKITDSLQRNKKKTKKTKKVEKSKKPKKSSHDNSNRGFKVHHNKFEITFQNR